MSEITIFVQNYRPKDEAISKEVSVLSKEFKTKIFNLRTRNMLIFSYDIIKLLFLKKEKNHIYTSSGDLIFLRLIRNKKNTILTAAAYSPTNKIKNNLKNLNKLKKIIVETQIQKDRLIKLGIDERKITIIYLGIKKANNTNKKKREGFKILFASSPPKENLFQSRGINLILDVAKELPEVKFTFLWRKVGYNKLMKLIKEKQIKNITVINKTIKDVNKEIETADALITPYITTTNKPVPNSIIEGISNNKPCIITNVIGISDLIKKEKCGLVTNPTKKDIIDAIIELKQNYQTYQQKCPYVFKKYFTEDKFKQNYKKIYQQL